MNAEKMAEFATSMRNCETHNATNRGGYASKDTSLEWSYKDFVNILYSDMQAMSGLSEHIDIDTESNEWMWCFSPIWMYIDPRFAGLPERVDYLLKHGLPDNWSMQIMGKIVPSYFNDMMKKGYNPLHETESMTELISSSYFTGKKSFKRSIVWKDGLKVTKSITDKVSMSKTGGVQYDRRACQWLKSCVMRAFGNATGKYASWFQKNSIL